jgi:orotidine-5'-phosphate decarboxylase
MVRTALANDAGVFVLALTSNPEGPEVQHATTADGRTVAGVVLESVAERNGGAAPLGSVGAVVGATIGDSKESFDVNGPLLVPGVGAQGGTADDVRRIFGRAVRNLLPSTSRQVLSVGPDKAALKAEAERLSREFAALTDA